MNYEAILLAVLGTAASVALGWMAWVSLQLISMGKRMVRVETKLENGLVTKLDALASRLEAHVDGEELRILNAMRRDPHTRTRRTDKVRHED